jgi:hypothetical protein
MNDMGSLGDAARVVCGGRVEAHRRVSNESYAILNVSIVPGTFATFLQAADLVGPFVLLACDVAIAITGQTLVLSHGELMN